MSLRDLKKRTAPPRICCTCGTAPASHICKDPLNGNFQWWECPTCVVKLSSHIVVEPLNEWYRRVMLQPEEDLQKMLDDEQAKLRERYKDLLTHLT